MAGFTHLHLHTTYSLLDGQCGISPLVAKAKALGMDSLAVTDHGNLFAAKAFYDEARKQGIKPILGVEAYIVDHDYRERHEYFQQHKGIKENRRPPVFPRRPASPWTYRLASSSQAPRAPHRSSRPFRRRQKP